MTKIKQELSTYEDGLAAKMLKALNAMNTKLQKEITNFLNLKMRIAFVKTGISQTMTLFESADDFFSSLEDNILLKLDDINFNHSKIIHTRDTPKHKK